jgi:hypothetical protein
MSSSHSKTIKRFSVIFDPTPVNLHTTAQLIRLREDLQSLAELVEVQYEVINALSDQVDSLQNYVTIKQKRRAKASK